MGDYSIWAIASVLFGLTCGVIYTLIARYRKFRGNPWRRFIVWTIIYILGAILLTRVLYHFLAD
ncbi:MAG: hypothetical protein HDR93_02500 [Bacteroides sp.]|nr:hypothetical protein [Bacteroides sp.]MBD5342114.1 hypothetical protein [Bacteroides sp.]